ncbi:MAG: GNAT family N-acetyltransferase [Austwickia sp.]|jgi:ribosomal-protein-alanine N-acetyltransferase|nr:GNAT family N-acetyltransferase [Austwickia sp.]MBK8436232.1 GNAT family N-acetyltransferase [Austwickia sp.]MBK9101910.1 GNAT family N-acetyltransferase [Austwickia sp.]
MTQLWPSLVTARDVSGLTIRLRGLRVRDRIEWEALRAANRAWLAPWEATSPYPHDQLRFRQLVRYYDAEASAGRMQPFVIEAGDRLVGQMHLFGITWGSMRGGAAGYWVSQDLAGRGIVPLALAALVDHAVYGLGLHRIEVNVRPENLASIGVMRKLGFREEGIRERYLHIDGGWRDHRSFALTAEDLAGTSMVECWNRRRTP